MTSQLKEGDQVRAITILGGEPFSSYIDRVGHIVDFYGSGRDGTRVRVEFEDGFVCNVSRAERSEL